VEIKAIACDVDGTLTDASGLLDLRAVETIRCLEAAGLPFILATARDYVSASALAVFIGTCGVVAAEDGSVIGNCRSRQPPLVLGDRAEIERGVAVLREALGDQLAVRRMPGTPGRIGNSATIRRTFDVGQGNAILERIGIQACLLDGGSYYHLVDVNTDKGRGVRKAARLLGADAEHVVAIGDNYNDLDMFAMAGYSIAVGNAPQAVKEKVDFACSASFGEGFREGLRHALDRFLPADVHIPLGTVR
jgi:phosphoglycolate phosphatase (TIGR01487 family)